MLTALNAVGYGVRDLKQEEATISTVMKYLPEVEEAVFLCHGASGTSDDGRGICLTFQDLSPVSFLPINESAELKNFLLTWRDMDTLTHTPRIFVSIACSSGSVVIGKGGTRLGIEQALFAKGTSVIISPLWNVEQESAVYWIGKFYEYRYANKDHSIGVAYQQACIATRKKYKFDYFWAPFVVKGAIN